MSQDDTPITMSTYGSPEACEAEQARRAASASQSNTAGPAKGGPDESLAARQDAATRADLKRVENCMESCDPDDRAAFYNLRAYVIAKLYDLAHVARQESAADTGAVAKGASMALPALPTAFATTRRIDGSLCNVYSPNQMHTYATTYGAQQREAGRLEADRAARQKVARSLDLSTSDRYSYAWEYLLGIIEECSEDDGSTIARRPASGGLTERAAFENWARKSFLCPDEEIRQTDDGYYSVSRLSAAWRAWEDRAGLAAVPPAKAEGLTERDAARWRFTMEFQDNPSGPRQPEAIVAMWRKVYAEHRLRPTREEYEAATDAAILAQQAKKGGAA